MVKERKRGFAFCANGISVRNQLYKEAKITCKKLRTGLFLPDMAIDICPGKGTIFNFENIFVDYKL